MSISGPVHQATNARNMGVGSNQVVVTITAPAAGNFLVACAAISDQSVTVSSVTGGGVTWTNRARNTGNGTASATGEIWEGLNSSGSGTSVTIALSNDADVAANVSEWSGVATSSAFDVAIATAVGNSTTPSSGSATTLNANDLLIAMWAEGGSTNASSGLGSSFTALTAQNSSGATPTRVECSYRIVSATASYSTSATWTKSRYAGALASWKAAAGPAPGFFLMFPSIQ